MRSGFVPGAGWQDVFIRFNLHESRHRPPFLTVKEAVVGHPVKKSAYVFGRILDLDFLRGREFPNPHERSHCGIHTEEVTVDDVDRDAAHSHFGPARMIG